MLAYFNRVWCLGRQSKKAYLRLYPNPGFMIPWFGGKLLRWSKAHKLTIKKGLNNASV